MDVDNNLEIKKFCDRNQTLKKNILQNRIKDLVGSKPQDQKLPEIKVKRP